MSHSKAIQAADIVLERRVGKGGRPKALTDRQLAIAQSLYADRQNKIPEICRTLKISKATLYRYIKTGKDTNNSECGYQLQGIPSCANHHLNCSSHSSLGS
jgi:DNA invertase Pin-like site-specific DNA recombinase